MRLNLGTPSYVASTVGDTSKTFAFFHTESPSGDATVGKGEKCWYPFLQRFLAIDLHSNCCLQMLFCIE